MRWSSGQVLLGLGVVVAMVAVVAGVRVAGTPGEGRMERLDNVRASDLRAIMASIDGFWGRNERLPDSLSELVADPRARVSVKDPGTDQEYEYRIQDEDSYELCAVFDLGSITTDRTPAAFSVHDAGRNCFLLDAAEPLGSPLAFSR